MPGAVALSRDGAMLFVRINIKEAIIMTGTLWACFACDGTIESVRQIILVRGLRAYYREYDGQSLEEHPANNLHPENRIDGHQTPWVLTDWLVDGEADILPRYQQVDPEQLTRPSAFDRWEILERQNSLEKMQ